MGKKLISTPTTVAGEAVGILSSENSTLQTTPKKWFIAYVGTCAEKVVRNRLNEKGYEAYAATRWEIRVRSNGRRVKIEHPVITQYVFVHVTEEERKMIVNYPYIHYFLTDKASEKDQFGRHRLAVVPDRQMQTLQAMLSEEDAVVQFASTGFSVGDEVSILGWDDDVTGHIVRISGDKGRYIGVRIQQLGCAYMEVSPKKLVLVSKSK